MRPSGTRLEELLFTRDGAGAEPIHAGVFAEGEHKVKDYHSVECVCGGPGLTSLHAKGISTLICKVERHPHRDGGTLIVLDSAAALVTSVQGCGRVRPSLPTSQQGETR